jgi:hypothetical protein
MSKKNTLTEVCTFRQSDLSDPTHLTVEKEQRCIQYRITAHFATLIFSPCR